MLLIQTYSAKLSPPSLQKGERFGAEQEAEVRALEEEACLRGSQLQSVLQVRHMTSALGFLGSTHFRHGASKLQLVEVPQKERQSWVLL